MGTRGVGKTNLQSWFPVNSSGKEIRLGQHLRRLERVFRRCSVCETMEDYIEGYLMVWTNYMSPCSSIVGLYFKGTCDVISVTMATLKVHKSVLLISIVVHAARDIHTLFC